MELTLFSFGFKYGIPEDVNFLCDVRFLDNPYWVDGLRGETGQEQRVANYVMKSEGAERFILQLENLLESIIEFNLRQKKEQVAIAIGCTGGRHRSVAVVEHVGNQLAKIMPELKIYHRDIEKDKG